MINPSEDDDTTLLFFIFTLDQRVYLPLVYCQKVFLLKDHKAVQTKTFFILQ